MTIISAFNDPLAVLVTNDLADMVPPDHYGTDPRASSVGTVLRPRSRKVEFCTRISTNLIAHIPAAPCARTTVVTMMSIMLLVVPWSGLCCRYTSA